MPLQCWTSVISRCRDQWPVMKKQPHGRINDEDRQGLTELRLIKTEDEDQPRMVKVYADREVERVKQQTVSFKLQNTIMFNGKGVRKSCTTSPLQNLRHAWDHRSETTNPQVHERHQIAQKKSNCKQMSASYLTTTLHGL